MNVLIFFIHAVTVPFRACCPALLWLPPAVIDQAGLNAQSLCRQNASDHPGFPAGLIPAFKQKMQKQVVDAVTNVVYHLLIPVYAAARRQHSSTMI
jgi:hypothetical protein